MVEKQETFEALVAPIVRYVSETPDRVPISDWHDTRSGSRVGFKARSVVGEFFMPILAAELIQAVSRTIDRETAPCRHVV
jgi:hypothetical protein